MFKRGDGVDGFLNAFKAMMINEAVHLAVEAEFNKFRRSLASYNADLLTFSLINAIQC